MSMEGLGTWQHSPCVVRDWRPNAGVDDAMYAIVYNGLSASRSSVVHLPVRQSGSYIVSRVDSGDGMVHEVQTTPSSTVAKGASRPVVSFDTGTLPPVGAATFRISMREQFRKGLSSSSAKIKRSLRSVVVGKHDVKSGEREASNGLVTVRFDKYVR